MTTETEKKICEIHAVVVKGAVSDMILRKVARAVVDARYYNGDDGWDRLKNSISALEDLVGRTRP